jgi:SpoVK/Ycf46/Vps4 family AAA+-type ATPase
MRKYSTTDTPLSRSRIEGTNGKKSAVRGLLRRLRRIVKVDPNTTEERLRYFEQEVLMATLQDEDLIVIEWCWPFRILK